MMWIFEEMLVDLEVEDGSRTTQPVKSQPSLFHRWLKSLRGTR